jgi:hypothetical protein
VALRRLEAVQQLQGSAAADESRPSKIRPISLEAKRTGKRSAGNPPATFGGWFGDAIGGWCAIRGRFAISRRFGLVGRGRLPEIIRPSSSASNSGSSNRAAVFAPMDSPANPSDARCREGLRSSYRHLLAKPKRHISVWIKSLRPPHCTHRLAVVDAQSRSQAFGPIVPAPPDGRRR